MKIQKKLVFLLLLILPFLISTLLTILPTNKNFNITDLPSSSAEGVSKYNITQSVKYKVEVNYSLTHTRLSPQTYYYKVARLNDRQPNSPITQYCAPYQESHLIYNSITGFDVIQYNHLDKFNNTYDLFNATLSQTESITLSQFYNVTLNEVKFSNIEDSDIGTYDLSNQIFDLYCNNSELYYNISDPDLISASNSIVDSLDNPVEKAKKICDWVASYLTYDGTLPAQEKGASWAYDNARGDCSEYSSLMVTLLRIQGIPARKVTGFCVSANPSLRPKIGQEWTFYVTKYSSNFLGHAWVEYYVPDIGWIACDPTWQSSGVNYFNRIDYLRFNVNIGAWFFLPGASPGYNYVSEFPFVASPVCGDHDAYDFTSQIKITVLGTNLNPLTTDSPLIPIIIIFGIVAISLILISVLVKGHHKKKDKLY
jgi:hypothetical protein